MEERREYPRKEESLEIEYGLENAVLGLSAKTYTYDISRGGVSIPLNKAIKPGATINMRIKIPPDGKEITILGKVIWKRHSNGGRARDEEAGIRFICMFKNTYEALERHVW
jgi:c-di-GMP-binding flagellar brake protein YcgR